ncbi:MAG TPA: SDR family NAD(P)-dependent oxidoreductase, partial [Blastocatellia bacterium]
MRLDGKVAVITGGGRGIGRAIALRFAAAGASVVVSGTSTEALEQTARDLEARGARAIRVIADVADEAAVAQVIARTLAAFGRLDILVNNAGIAGPTALVTEVKREDWERTLAVNLTGAFLCA